MSYFLLSTSNSSGDATWTAPTSVWFGLQPTITFSDNLSGSSTETDLWTETLTVPTQWASGMMLTLDYQVGIFGVNGTDTLTVRFKVEGTTVDTIVYTGGTDPAPTTALVGSFKVYRNGSSLLVFGAGDSYVTPVVVRSGDVTWSITGQWSSTSGANSAQLIGIRSALPAITAV